MSVTTTTTHAVRCDWCKCEIAKPAQPIRTINVHMWSDRDVVATADVSITGEISYVTGDADACTKCAIDILQRAITQLQR